MAEGREGFILLAVGSLFFGCLFAKITCHIQLSKRLLKFCRTCDVAGQAASVGVIPIRLDTETS